MTQKNDFSLNFLKEDVDSAVDFLTFGHCCSYYID